MRTTEAWVLRRGAGGGGFGPLRLETIALPSISPDEALVRPETLQRLVATHVSAETPIVVCSPVLRPDAESTPNKLGATLADLRGAIEATAGEAGVTLVSGDGVLQPHHLADGIHPGDEGHRVLADVFGSAVAAAVGT